MSSNHKKKPRSESEDYRIYYGIPHCHTAASTGKGTVKEAIEHCRGNGLDYIIISDHYTYMNKSSKNHKTVWGDHKDDVSWYRHHHKDFLPILGFEYKLFQNLDINIISVRKCIDHRLTIDEFRKWLKNNNAIGIINHPGESINRIKNNLELNEFIHCIETGNGSYPGKYHRYYKNYFHLLDLGWKLAAVNGQDNHRKNWGDSDNVTAVITRKLNEDSLKKAFLQRNTYSTESRTLKVKFSINGQIMGSIIKIKGQESLNFSIAAEDLFHPIQKIKVFSNKGMVIRESQNLDMPKTELFFSIDSGTANWFVVNLLMENNREAITSPIFIEYI
ncbi:MAG: CehA/McbA family metallohydrolase [Bacillota bacterium]|nr:CehA/McbA family metallohydrolase [Bacillota bacterium]